MMTVSPGFKSGTTCYSMQATKRSPVIGPSTTSGAIIPLRPSPATKVVVFQWPWGMSMTRRFPRGARPWVRVKLVLAHVSSKKNHHDGSMAGCRAFQSSCCIWTSGRSWSLARMDFFRDSPRTINERAKADFERGILNFHGIQRGLHPASRQPPPRSARRT